MTPRRAGPWLPPAARGWRAIIAGPGRWPGSTALSKTACSAIASKAAREARGAAPKGRSRLDLVLLEQVVERRPAGVEHAGGLGDVAVGNRQRLAQRLALGQEA